MKVNYSLLVILGTTIIALAISAFLYSHFQLSAREKECKAYRLYYEAATAPTPIPTVAPSPSVPFIGDQQATMPAKPSISVTWPAASPTSEMIIASPPVSPTM